MLLLDVSNIMYTGASSSAVYFGESNEFKLHSIPYFFQKIAAYFGKDTEMIAVFEKVGKMPALSSSSAYKGGRNRNPMVEWEISALKEMLRRIGFPVLEVEGQEADYVINNYCRLNRDKENIYILSADQDLAANVRCGEFKTEMLSYSTVSYNINKANFKAITGVDYNFMNLNKILLGCKSDNIKPFPLGREIYNSYIGSLESNWRRQFGYRIGVDSTSNLDDDFVLYYSNFEQFLSWYSTSKYFNEDLVQELHNRRLLIEGPQFSLPKLSPNDWRTYNQLIAAFHMNTSCAIKSIKLGHFDPELYELVQHILRKAQTANVSMFDGPAKELDGLQEVGDIQNILGILDSGGAL